MPEPRASRPGFDAAYGIATESDGLLPWSWAIERLERSRNYWICTTRRDGRPHAMPVWGVWVADALVFSTGAGSVKARNLAANPELVAHLESGDEVVILEGRAERVGRDFPGLLAAYGSKYAMTMDEDPGDGSPWLALRPRRAYAWLEAEFPRTATRFDFGSA